ncbi:MAG: hypothetical protein KTR25_01405 [Myxococcales bacterium]|nr:hypothetical protein [Myxococcales bacterium]
MARTRSSQEWQGGKQGPGFEWTEVWPRYQLVEPFVQGRRVLEVGTFDTRGLARLVRAGAERVVGATSQLARVEGPREALELVPMSPGHINFPDQAFDVLLVVDLAQEMAANDNFFDELRRVMEVNALLLLGFAGDGLGLDALLGERKQQIFVAQQLMYRVQERYPDAVFFHQQPFIGLALQPKNLPQPAEFVAQMPLGFNPASYILAAVGPTSVLERPQLVELSLEDLNRDIIRDRAFQRKTMNKLLTALQGARALIGAQEASLREVRNRLPRLRELLDARHEDMAPDQRQAWLESTSAVRIQLLEAELEEERRRRQGDEQDSLTDAVSPERKGLEQSVALPEVGAELNELRREREMAASRAQTLESTLLRVETEVVNLRREREARALEMESLVTALSELEEKVTILRSERDSAKQWAQTSETALAEVEAELVEQFRERKAAEARVSTAEGVAQQERQSRLIAEDQLRDAHHALSEASAQTRAAEQAWVEAQPIVPEPPHAANREVQRVVTALERSEQQGSELTKQLAELEESYEVLSTERGHLLHQHQMLENALEASKGEVQHWVRAADTHRQELERTAVGLKTTGQLLSDREAQLTRLEQNLLSLGRERRALELTAQHLATELEKYRARAVTLYEERETLSTTSRILLRERDNALSERDDARSALAAAKGQVHDYSVALTSSELDLERAKREANRANLGKEEAQLRRVVLEDALNIAEGRLHTYENRCRSAEEALGEERAGQGGLTEEVVDQERLVVSLRTAIEEHSGLEELMQEAFDVRTNLEGALEVMEGECSRLAGALKETQELAAQVNAELTERVEVAESKLKSSYGEQVQLTMSLAEAQKITESERFRALRLKDELGRSSTDCANLRGLLVRMRDELKLERMRWLGDNEDHERGQATALVVQRARKTEREARMNALELRVALEEAQAIQVVRRSRLGVSAGLPGGQEPVSQRLEFLPLTSPELSRASDPPISALGENQPASSDAAAGDIGRSGSLNAVLARSEALSTEVTAVLQTQHRHRASQDEVFRGLEVTCSQAEALVSEIQGLRETLVKVVADDGGLDEGLDALLARSEKLSREVTSAIQEHLHRSVAEAPSATHLSKLLSRAETLVSEVADVRGSLEEATASDIVAGDIGRSGSLNAVLARSEALSTEVAAVLQTQHRHRASQDEAFRGLEVTCSQAEALASEIQGLRETLVKVVTNDSGLDEGLDALLARSEKLSREVTSAIQEHLHRSVAEAPSVTHLSKLLSRAETLVSEVADVRGSLEALEPTHHSDSESFELNPELHQLQEELEHQVQPMLEQLRPMVWAVREWRADSTLLWSSMKTLPQSHRFSEPLSFRDDEADEVCMAEVRLMAANGRAELAEQKLRELEERFGVQCQALARFRAQEDKYRLRNMATDEAFSLLEDRLTAGRQLVTKMTQQLGYAEDELCTLRDKHDELLTQLESAKRLLGEAQEESRSHRRELSVLQETLAHLLLEVVDPDTVTQLMTQALAEAPEKRDSVEIVKEPVRRWSWGFSRTVSDRLQETEARLAQAESARVRAEAEIGRLQGELEGYEEAIAEVHRRADSLDTEIVEASSIQRGHDQTELQGPTDSSSQAEVVSSLEAVRNSVDDDTFLRLETLQVALNEAESRVDELIVLQAKAVSPQRLQAVEGRLAEVERLLGEAEQQRSQAESARDIARQEAHQALERAAEAERRAAVHAHREQEVRHQLTDRPPMERKDSEPPA